MRVMIILPFLIAINLLWSSAEAVNVSSDGRGQVALFPFYSTRSSGSELRLINTRAEKVAVKIRMIEGDPRDVTTPRVFEVISYLDAYQEAVFALGPSPAAIGPKAPCWQKSADQPSFDFGSIEVFQMAALPAQIDIQNCAALERAWQGDGDFAQQRVSLGRPPGGLIARLEVADTGGVQHHITPTMLDGFTAKALHFRAGDVHPHFADVNPKESFVFRQSRAGGEESGFVHSHWNNANARPSDPVRAVLIQNWLSAPLDVRELNQNSFTLALNFPLRRFDSQPVCYRSVIEVFGHGTPTSSQEASACRSSSLLSARSQDIFIQLPGQIFATSVSQGWLKVSFHRDLPQLISDEFDVYSGLAVIATGFSSSSGLKGRISHPVSITYSRERP